MKIKGEKFLVLILLFSIITFVFWGCGNNTKKQIKNKNTELEKINNNKITILGSSSLQPLAEISVKGFKTQKPNVTINVQGGGSGAGINQVAQGNCDIGISDVVAEIKLKDKSKLKDLIDYKVCGMGFAMVVSKDVSINSLTENQIQKIFSGEINNWKDVGGEDREINIINRPSSSGTRTVFTETIMKKYSIKNNLGITQNSSGAVKTALKTTNGGISYLALSYLTKEVRKDVKVLKINNIEPSIENIINKKYNFWSYGHMYTKDLPEDGTKEFLDFIVSKENEEAVKKLGYIPIDSLK